MNYRHAFHAGNFADVFKHAILIGLLEALKAKPAAFCYVDTHAGRGRYDLRGEHAERTREHADGVQRLLAADGLPPLLARYVELVRDFDGTRGGTLAQYPGSPLIASRLMREQDRAILCELHEEDAAALRAALHGDARFAVHRRDGYAALKALLPPAQKRGLVLIDPPFEAADEFASLAERLMSAYRKWPTGLYAVWYPIKDEREVAAFARRLASGGMANVLRAELRLSEVPAAGRLAGSGMVIVNPPWTLQDELSTLMPPLAKILSGSAAGAKVDALICKN